MLGLASSVASKLGRAMHAPKWTENPTVWRHFHAAMTAVWFLLITPSVLWWRDSVPWIVVMSVWANLVGHFSAWQGSRAEDSNGD